MPNPDTPSPNTDSLQSASDTGESVDDLDLGTVIDLTVTEEDAGQRLDRFLVAALASQDPPPSRSRIHALLKEDRIVETGVDQAQVLSDRSAKVKEGQHLQVTLPAPIPTDPLPEDIPLDILFEDDALIVVNKPAGMVVHPAPGALTGTLVNALLHHCGDSLQGIGGELRPGIVHRLDKDTSGVMVVAKTEPALHYLQEQFAAHGRDGRLVRAYSAWVWGAVQPPEGIIDQPIGRSPHNRRKMAIRRSGGREAITHYKARETYADGLVTRLECRLETGRTHQIRVHLTQLGHPLLGDPTYGGSQKTRLNKLSPEAQQALAALNRQALHAFELGFEHPETKEQMLFQQELPVDLNILHEKLTNS